jgi:hypothetical protein
MVLDRGDRCLFIFVWARRLFFDVLPFPVCKDELIGDWYENRQGTPNTINFLIMRQYYWRTDAPCANRNGGPNRKIKLLAHDVWSAMPIGRGVHQCANILAHRCTPCHYYWRTDGFTHRVGRVLGFSPVVGIGTFPTPYSQARMPSLWFRGELHTRLRERRWESLNSDEGT